MSTVTLQIDGKTLSAEPGSTILQTAEEVGIEIPTLCHIDWLNETGGCMVCVVEEEFQGLLPACSTRIWDGMRLHTDTKTVRQARKEAVSAFLSEHYADCEPPCTAACPAGIDIQGYIQLIAQGRPRAAIDLIRETNPFTAVCGRVCTHPCEDACRRQLVEDPISIMSLKRYAADREKQQPVDSCPTVESTGKAVAVIGAGPAGLTVAYHLARLGHEVEVFESESKPGGMLRYGIPDYRLPPEELDHDISYITGCGVEIHTDTAVGADIPIRELQDNHDAVFIATGAGIGWTLDIPGSSLAGVLSGLEFLNSANRGKSPEIGKRVAVIGGGNTAIDSARTALRLGAESVHVVYRRAREQMPAHPVEIQEAEEEGVTFTFLSSPVQFLGEDRITSLQAIRMRLGEPDASGRARPIPIEDSEYEMQVDSVIMAIGQQPSTSVFEEIDGLQLASDESVEVDEYTFETTLDDVYAGGDVVLGAATAVEAIGAGHQAALAIHERLTGHQLKARQRRFNLQKADLDNLLSAEFEQVASTDRKTDHKLDGLTRKDVFSEVNLGLQEDEAIQEAKRCLECGCKARETCSLRELAEVHDIETSDLPLIRHFRQIRDDHPFIEHDPNRCISCGQCVRVCADVQGVSALALTDRVSLVGVSDSLEDTRCESCGQCITACPTGAISAQDFTTPANEIKTTCPYCGVGCGVVLGTRANKIISVRGDLEHPVSEGMLCVKGHFGYDFVHHPDRLQQPLIRRDGELVPVSWEEALKTVADGLAGYVGTDRIGVIGSAKCTNEEMYALQRFARAILQTNNVDHCARLCHAPSVAGLNAAFGSGAMTNSINDIPEADCILSIGSNTTESHPIIGVKVKEAVSAGGNLIVANPLWIDLCRYADIWLQHRPGTDVALLLGMAKVIVDENLHDREFIQKRCEDFEEFSQMLQQVQLAEVERITGVDRDKIAEAARLYAESDCSALLYAMGITQHSHGTDNVMSVANLAMLTGNLGKPGTGVNPLRGQNNVQGACDLAVLPNVFPGYQPVGDPQVQKKFADAYGTDLPTEPGLPMTDMIEKAHEGELDAFYLVGENPVMSEADSGRTRKVLRDLDFLVVQDLFLTETAQFADVVLPAASFAEKDGTFVNTERRIQRVRKAVDAPGQARDDLQIIVALAEQMGAGSFSSTDPAEVMDEIASLVPTWAGVSYDRLQEEELAWPCLDREHPGTPILYRERFLRENGLAKFTSVQYKPSRELPDDDYPLILTTGRVLPHFHTGTMTRRVAGLNYIHPREVVRINPKDADRFSIKDGEKLKISSRRGEVTAEAGVTEEVPQGTVFMTFHFAEACANELTNPVLDPASKIPEFKVCAVRVEPV